MIKNIEYQRKKLVKGDKEGDVQQRKQVSILNKQVGEILTARMRFEKIIGMNAQQEGTKIGTFQAQGT